MPIRRPSASAAHGSSHHTSGASRSHRSNVSHHNVAVTGPAQPPSIAYSAASATPQQKIVQALINRLKNKVSHVLMYWSRRKAALLPCNLLTCILNSSLAIRGSLSITSRQTTRQCE